jgi:hypothetical protein
MEKENTTFMPQNFKEAVDYLVRMDSPTDDPHYHFSGGMAMRNSWGLWHNKTPIAKWFTEHELYHGDDRSGILCDAVKAAREGKEFDVLGRIKYYQNWWVKTYGEKYSLDKVREEFFKYNKD